MPALMLGMGKLVSSRISDQMEKPLHVPVVGASNAPNLVAWLQGQNIVVKPAPADPDEAIRSQKEDVILRIDGKFGEQWRGSIPAVVEILHDSSRQDADIPVERLRNLLDGYGSNVGALRLVARGIAPTTAQPLRVSDRDLATPEARRGAALAFLPYMLILFSFLGGAYLVIDATAGERERNSLEPLLATPARRAVIMSGKILAACVLGVFSITLTLAAFKLSFQFQQMGIKLDVSMSAIACILLVLLPMISTGISNGPISSAIATERRSRSTSSSSFFITVNSELMRAIPLQNRSSGRRRLPGWIRRSARATRPASLAPSPCRARSPRCDRTARPPPA
jgi:sodium transport system permease protein